MIQLGSIIDDLELVVSELRETPDGPPYFIPGHPAELMQRLANKTKAAKQKYPLIYLKLDFPEPPNVGGMQAFDLNLGIMYYTKERYTTEQRRTLVFNPILVPLYNKFLLGIRNANKFSWAGNLDQEYPPHTPILRPFWGTQVGGNNVKKIVSDPLDCIEIVNLKINKRIKNC